MYGPLTPENEALLKGYLEGTDFDVFVRNFEGTDENPYTVVEMFHTAESGLTATQLLPIGPVAGTTSEPKANVIRAEYGDGYSQRTPEGLNHIRQEATLRWTHKSLYQWRIIRDFLRPKLQGPIFSYTEFGDVESRRWVCMRLTGPTPEHGNLYTFSAKLIEEFGD